VECIPGADVVKMVLVEWIDSCEPQPNAEVEKNDLPEPQKILQCGFLVFEDRSYITVAGGVKPDLGTYDYVIAIPKVAITNMSEVLVSEPPKKRKR
jgi:hypothetical protein